MKSCKTCLKDKPLTEYYSNGFTPNGVKKYKPSCKPCEYTSQHKRYTDIVREFYGVWACTVCGYDKCEEALDLHHRDPTTKERRVSSMINFTKAKIIAECEKCDLLCANCHREEHVRLKLGV